MILLPLKAVEHLKQFNKNLLEQLKWKVKVVTIEDFSKRLFFKYSKAPRFSIKAETDPQLPNKCPGTPQSNKTMHKMRSLFFFQS